jgi:hypothetical protein
MQEIRAVERLPVPRIAWAYFNDYFSVRYECREDERFGLFACRVEVGLVSAWQCTQSFDCRRNSSHSLSPVIVSIYIDAVEVISNYDGIIKHV